MPNIPQPPLDDIDRRILRVLAQDGRIPNNALASRAGIAPSTCLARVRSLHARGVIRGFHADVDLASVGRPIQAMIAVRLDTHARAQVDAFWDLAPRLPGVIEVFHVAGANDYLLHVAAADAHALRDFVLDHLTAHPNVRHAETSLIFEQVRGTTPPL